MSKPTSYGPSFDRNDAIGELLDTVARILLYAGIGAVVVGAGFLGFYYFHYASHPPTSYGNIDLFSKVLLVGVIAGAAGSMYLFWGEEFLLATLLIVAGLFFFAPVWLPLVSGSTSGNDYTNASVEGVHKSGVILGVIGILGLLGEIFFRVRVRFLQGARSEQLKFGRGVQEEKHQNKFLGKCWQLPYCRKFVRERCPIFHARRTCWKERVGCMCEEEVIQNAMQNKAIPKDAIAAARYIPVNNKITGAQKRERCKQCVIYNEHLRHKYKLMLPITIGAFILMYAVFRSPMLGWSEQAILRFNDILGHASEGQASIQHEGVLIFREILVDCLMFVALAYVLKILEFVIFTLKV